MKKNQSKITRRNTHDCEKPDRFSFPRRSLQTSEQLKMSVFMVISSYFLSGRATEAIWLMDRNLVKTTETVRCSESYKDGESFQLN